MAVLVTPSTHSDDGWGFTGCRTDNDSWGSEGRTSPLRRGLVVIDREAGVLDLLLRALDTAGGEGGGSSNPQP